MDRIKKNLLLLVRLMLKTSFVLFTIFGCLITSSANAEKINAVSEGKIISNQSMAVGVFKAAADGVKLQKQNNTFYVARSFKPDKFTLKAQIKLKNINGTGAAFLYDNNKLIFDCARSNFCKQKGAIGFWGRELVGEGVDGYYGIKIIADSKNWITPGKLFNFELDCDGKTLKFLINGRFLKELPYLTRQNHTFGFTAHDGEILIRNLEVDGSVAGDAKIFTPDWVSGVRMNIPVIENPLEINRDHHLLLKIEHHTPIGTYTAKLTPTCGGNTVSFHIDVSEVTCDEIEKYELTAGMERFYVSANIPGKILEQAFAAGGNSFSAKPFILSLSNNEKEVLRQVLILYQSKSKNKFPVCSIQKYKGVPSIAVNGISLGTIPARLSRFARAPRFSGISVSEFDKAGIKVNIITVRPSQFYRDGKFDIDAICKYIDINLCRTVASAPDALIWFDWQLYMPKQWCDEHPQEMIKLENGLKFLQHSPGQILQPSYASSSWRKDAGKILHDTLLRLSSSLWADRIIMVRTSYGNAGEWNHWGYKSKQFVDFSVPMQKSFGKWLKEKYKNVDRLRAAWNDPNVSFNSLSLVPSSKARIAANDSILYHIGPKGQPAVDYYTFFQEFAVETIEYFAKIVKNVSNDKLLAGAYYGYYLSHINNTPYHLQDSGHYGLQYYLRSKYLDFLGGPYPYHQRQNRLQINGLYSSIALHNKVWFSENDQRTHLSDKSIHDRYGATSSVSESIAIAKRDYMVNFSKSTSYYYFDFIKDWFITPEFMEAVGEIKHLDDIVMKNGGRPSRAEIAILFSERSVPYYANHPVLEDSSLRGFLCALRNMFETEMDRTGAPWDLYAVSDMDQIDFSKYKLIIFANSAYVTDETIRLTKTKLFEKGKTVMFIGLPGVLGGENLDYQRSKEFTGVSLRQAEAGLHFKNLFFNPKLHLWLDLQKLPLISEYWISDTLPIRAIIEDPDAEPFAWFDQSKDVAVAQKQVASGRSILFTAMAPPKADILTALFKIAGVHIYYDQSKSKDSFYCAGDLIAVFSRVGGKKKIDLPSKAEIVMDVFSGEILGEDCNTIVFTLPENKVSTKILFVGSKKTAQTYRKLSKEKSKL